MSDDDDDYRRKLDELTIRTNATREAWGYQVRAANIQREAALADQRAREALMRGEREAEEFRARVRSAMGIPRTAMWIRQRESMAREFLRLLRRWLRKREGEK